MMQGTSFNAKQITTLIDKMSQSKANGYSEAKDVLKSYLTATNMESSVEDLDGEVRTIISNVL